MQTSTGVLTEVKVAGPFKSNKGYNDYFRHTYQVGDQKFSKIVNKQEPLFTEGTTVTVLFEAIKTEKGVFNQIDKIVQVEGTGQGGSSTEATGTKGNSGVTFTGSTSTSIGTIGGGGTGTAYTVSKDTKITDLTKNLMIARMNAVTSAIALVHKLDDAVSSDLALGDVLDIAEEILAFTTEPLNNQ